MSVRISRTVAVLLLLAAHAVASAPAGAPKSMQAVRTPQAPVIDGVLGEDAWSLAAPATGFTQYEPDEGAAATESTAVRILYDDRALYVGVLCYDSDPGGIVARLTRRDRTTESDRFTVQIDSYHDRQTAYVFSTSAAGVQSDGVLSQDGVVYDIQWDAVWSVRTRVTGTGWSAEFQIPFHALRFVETDDGAQEWGINFRRYVSRKRETTEWVLIPRSERAAVSLWGTLTGIREIDPPLHLEVLPYVLGRSTFRTAAGGRAASSDGEAAAGLDLKYGLTRGFTLDAAVNPDFGQVEVDEAVLNLTVFETLFPEKRPFFTEGAALFAFGTALDGTSLPLFFSRRIGGRPEGAAFVDGRYGDSVESNPQFTTILGAVKLSGRTPAGMSLGVLAAVTDEEDAVVRTPGGGTASLRTEPLGFSQVVRLKQEIATTSWIGGMLAGRARDGALPALAGGVDWNLRLDGGRHAVDGYAAGSLSSRDGERSGGAARLLFSRISAEHWFYTAAYDAFSRRFDPNDPGFFAQPREHGGYAQLVYRENFADRPLRRYSAAINPELRWNWDGVRTHAAVNSAASGELENFWILALAHTAALPAHDDAERGIIGIYRRPFSQELSASVQTDERSPVSGVIGGGYLFDAREKRSVTAYAQLKLRPASWVDLAPAVTFRRTRGDRTAVLRGGAPVVEEDGGRFFTLFGDRDVDELALALRGTVTLTTDLSIQAYGQVLLARGTHRNTALLTGDAHFRATSPAGSSYDFNIAVVNANMLLRWEYLPGSTLYLVWTQGRAGDSGVYGTAAGTRFREAFALPHDDVVVLKAAYWFPL